MKNSKILAVSALALSLMMSACGSPEHKTDTPASETASSIATASKSASAKPSPSAPSVAPKATATPKPAPSTPPASGTALNLLNTLTVKPADNGTTYNRELFGEPWEDVDGNGCDTRNDMLLRDLKNITVDANECTVLLGTLVDPYTGKTINFDRSKGGGGGIDIDHLVALSAAFRTGASTWNAEKKLQFANDPLNLLPSGSGPNRAKGDKDASEWLPETAGNPAFNCRYVARQVSVKAKYGSWVTPSEKSAMLKVLNTCPTEPAPTDNSIKVAKDTPVSASKTNTPKVTAPKVVTPAPAKPVPAPASNGTVDPDYGSCAKAKAAGAGPYTTADPEYKFYRDGDGDGTVCE